jgi:type II secretory pathway component GspD/PulD (secretin)
MKRMKTSSLLFMGEFIFILTLTMIFLSSANFGWCAENGNTFTQNTSKFSFNFQKEPLQDVCKSISQATGYEIKFDDNFANLPITAAFEETTAFGALKKVLRNHNHSLVINEEKHSIEVFIMPSGNLSDVKRLAAIPSQNEESGFETYPAELNNQIEDYDPIAAEAIEEYAQEYIMQTTTDEDSELIESSDIETYAEEYINRIKDNDPPSIEAESIEAYAQEYMKQVQATAGEEVDLIEAGDINAYAEAYINHTSKNKNNPPPIIASDIYEYANEYIRRQHNDELGIK